MNRVKFCESLHTVAFSFLACEHAWNHQNDDATCFTNAEVSTACCVNLRSLFLRTVHNYYEGFIFSVARRDDSISSDACGDHMSVAVFLSVRFSFISLVNIASRALSSTRFAEIALSEWTSRIKCGCVARAVFLSQRADGSTAR